MDKRLQKLEEAARNWQRVAQEKLAKAQQAAQEKNKQKVEAVKVAAREACDAIGKLQRQLSGLSVEKMWCGKSDRRIEEAEQVMGNTRRVIFTAVAAVGKIREAIEAI
jgi:hypothetical protein